MFLLDNHRCCDLEDDPIWIIGVDNGNEVKQLGPCVFLIKECLLQATYDSDKTKIPISVLLDTGSDLTVISSECIKKLDKVLTNNIHTERKNRVYGILYPTYDLTIFLPSGHRLESSELGITAVAQPRLFVAADVEWDVIVGRDILNRFVTTFDGPKGTVTIMNPAP